MKAFCIFVKGLLMAPFCVALYVAYVIIGMAFGLSLIIGKPTFLEDIAAVFIVVLKASFEEVAMIFCRLVFGEKEGS